MSSNFNSPDHFDIARRRAGARLGFCIHLGVFVVVMIVLIIINLSLTPGYKWFVWPLLGWGIGLLGHAAGIFYFPSALRRMTEQELRKIDRDGE
jgi:hypothetical protein